MNCRQVEPDLFGKSFYELLGREWRRDPSPTDDITGAGYELWDFSSAMREAFAGLAMKRITTRYTVGRTDRSERAELVITKC